MLRAGQYAQAGSRKWRERKWRTKEGQEARDWLVDARLTFVSAFARSFLSAFRESFGGALTKGRPIRGREVFAFGFTFVSTLPFVKGCLIRSTCGTLCNDRGKPNGSVGVSELGHISSMAA